MNRKGGPTDPNFLTLAVPRLSVCADAQKVDRAKLAQTEVKKATRNVARVTLYLTFFLSRICFISRFI